ncbi:hypothetical protein PTKIN_Ptkin04bG0175200 [Pterospermum kingtungense]
MGHCMMRTSRSRQLEEEETEEIREAATEFEKENGEVGKDSIKVKIVLRKEELALLFLKMKNNNGGKSLEDLLAEMEKARSGKVDSWRPPLESIMEEVDPEGLEMDRS